MAEQHLTFAVFVLHILAAAWNKSPSEAYAICRDTGVLDKYIVPHYEVLHSLGTNALIEDLTGYVRDRGAKI